MCQLALSAEDLSAMEKAAGNNTFHESFTVHALIKDARAAQGLVEEVRKLRAEKAELAERLERVANDAQVAELRLHQHRHDRPAVQQIRR